jgi:hypothetical protein
MGYLRYLIYFKSTIPRIGRRPDMDHNKWDCIRRGENVWVLRPYFCDRTDSISTEGNLFLLCLSL